MQPVTHSPSSACDVAVVGAGPYGLACAAHLRAADGLDVRVLGDPMSFWRQHMPRGMLLRSPYVASDIGDPNDSLTLDAYGASTGAVSAPVPLDRFVDYGSWFHQKVAPDVDRRPVERLSHTGSDGFRLSLADGDELKAQRVVIAAGIGPFSFRPPEFEGLPPSHVSHASERDDLTEFAGQRVAVIGGGQSALESAALLREAGADVEVLVRAPRIYYLRRVGMLHNLGPITTALFAPAEVGPAGVSRIVSVPDWYRRMPRRIQDRFFWRSLRPAGAAWLQPRLEGVPIRTESAVKRAAAVNGHVRLELGDGSERVVDHVLLGTGYRVDISRYPFLDRGLLQHIRTRAGHPQLSTTFESSVPGLYFAGATAGWSFGPLMRFVAGTSFAARALTRGVMQSRR
jgi:cation diffusion facilitator CzcD-associated flavoprotein CzcO